MFVRWNTWKQSLTHTHTHTRAELMLWKPNQLQQSSNRLADKRRTCTAHTSIIIHNDNRANTAATWACIGPYIVSRLGSYQTQMPCTVCLFLPSLLRLTSFAPLPFRLSFRSLDRFICVRPLHSFPYNQNVFREPFLSVLVLEPSSCVSRNAIRLHSLIS